MRLADEKPQDGRMLNPDRIYSIAGLFELKQPGSCRVPCFPPLIGSENPRLQRNSLAYFEAILRFHSIPSAQSSINEFASDKRINH